MTLNQHLEGTLAHLCCDLLFYAVLQSRAEHFWLHINLFRKIHQVEHMNGVCTPDRCLTAFRLYTIGLPAKWYAQVGLTSTGSSDQECRRGVVLVRRNVWSGLISNSDPGQSSPTAPRETFHRVSAQNTGMYTCFLQRADELHAGPRHYARLAKGR